MPPRFPQHTIPDRPGDRRALKPHPPAARHRRITRTVASAVAVSVIPLIAWALGWLPLTVAITGLVVLACAGAALGELRSSQPRPPAHRPLTRDRTADSRPATLPAARRQHHRLVGTARRGPASSGLVTLVAASAAGTEAYRIVDIHGDDASALAAEISPGLIEAVSAPVTVRWIRARTWLGSTACTPSYNSAVARYSRR